MTPGQTKLIAHLLKEAVAACDDHLETLYEEYGFQRPYTFKQDGVTVLVISKPQARKTTASNRARAQRTGMGRAPRGVYREVADYIVSFIDETCPFKVDYDAELRLLPQGVDMVLITFNLLDSD